MAYTASQTTLLYMKRPNKTESPIFVFFFFFFFFFFCAFFVSKGNLLDFRLLTLKALIVTYLDDVITIIIIIIIFRQNKS